MTTLDWRRLGNGDHVVNDLPIRLTKTGDVTGKFWVVQVPIEVDRNMLTGWSWGDVFLPPEGGGPATEPLMAGTTISEAMSTVRDNLVAILGDAVKQRSGWPHFGGIPDEMGEYISHYGTDGSIRYTSEPVEAPPDSDACLPEKPGDLARSVDLSLGDQLRDVIIELTCSIDEFRESVPHSVDTFIRTLRPEEVRDVNGRPILGDMLAGKANALAALANLERSTT